MRFSAAIRVRSGVDRRDFVGDTGFEKDSPESAGT